MKIIIKIIFNSEYFRLVYRILKNTLRSNPCSLKKMLIEENKNSRF